VSNFIQTVPVNERILPESLRSAASLGAVGFGRLGRGGTDSTPCPAGHLFPKSVDCRSGREPLGLAARQRGARTGQLTQFWQQASDGQP